MLLGKVIKMFDYKLLKEEGKIFVSENEKDIFEANVIFKDDIVVLDMIRLSKDKIDFLQDKESSLKQRFEVLCSVTKGVKTFLCENGLSVKRVFLGSFADVKELDLEVSMFEEANKKEPVSVKSTSRR